MNITGLLRSLQVASVVKVVQVPDVPIARLFKPLLVRASKFVKRGARAGEQRLQKPRW